MRKSLSIIVPLLSALAAQAAHAAPLYVFGDSLSDVGNVYVYTGGEFPAPPYYNGEYSNGPNWVQGLASRLGDAPLTPSLAGGTNYAFGGASTAPLPYTPNPAFTDLIGTTTSPGQIAQFLSAHSSADPNALYVVEIGSNDVRAVVENIPNLATAKAELNISVTNVDTAINDLAAAGAKNFLLVNVGNVGIIPEIEADGLQSSATRLSAYFNSTLANGSTTIPSLTSLEQTDSINIFELNFFRLSNQIVSDPSAYGLTDVTDPCYTGTLDGFADTADPGTVCASPDQYFFWDQIHPTAAGSAVIANAAFDALTVPEPSSMLLLGAGLLGLFVCNRRRAGLPDRNRRAFTPPAAIQDFAQAGCVP